MKVVEFRSIWVKDLVSCDYDIAQFGHVLRMRMCGTGQAGTERLQDSPDLNPAGLGGDKSTSAVLVNYPPDEKDEECLQKLTSDHKNHREDTRSGRLSLAICCWALGHEVTEEPPNWLATGDLDKIEESKRPDDVKIIRIDHFYLKLISAGLFGIKQKASKVILLCPVDALATTSEAHWDALRSLCEAFTPKSGKVEFAPNVRTDGRDMDVEVTHISGTSSATCTVHVHAVATLADAIRHLYGEDALPRPESAPRPEPAPLPYPPPHSNHRPLLLWFSAISAALIAAIPSATLIGMLLSEGRSAPDAGTLPNDQPQTGTTVCPPEESCEPPLPREVVPGELRPREPSVSAHLASGRSLITCDLQSDKDLDKLRRNTCAAIYGLGGTKGLTISGEIIQQEATQVRAVGLRISSSGCICKLEDTDVQADFLNVVEGTSTSQFPARIQELVISCKKQMSQGCP